MLGQHNHSFVVLKELLHLMRCLIRQVKACASITTVVLKCIHACTYAAVLSTASIRNDELMPVKMFTVQVDTKLVLNMSFDLRVSSL